MGITCVLRRVTADEVRRLADGRLDIAAFLFGPEPRKVAGLRGLFSWLKRATDDPPSEIALPASETPSGDELDIDKAWHGLHFLFTGEEEGGDEPACYLLHGGEEVSEPEDHEIGLDTPARALHPDQARRFADFLEAISTAELAKRYNPEGMAKLKIYPDAIWTRAPGKDEEGSPLEYLLEHFALLREFVAGAARRGDGLIIYQS